MRSIPATPGCGSSPPSCVLLALWEVAGRAGMLNPMYVPMPSRVGAALY